MYKSRGSESGKNSECLQNYGHYFVKFVANTYQTPCSILTSFDEMFLRLGPQVQFQSDLVWDIFVYSVHFV